MKKGVSIYFYWIKANCIIGGFIQHFVDG